jgi:hypothetical protein
MLDTWFRSTRTENHLGGIFCSSLEKASGFHALWGSKKKKRLGAMTLPLQKTEEFSQADLKRRTVHFWTFGQHNCKVWGNLKKKT